MMILIRNYVSVTLIIGLLSTIARAGPTVHQTRKTGKGNQENKEEKIQFDLGVNYSASTDLADERNPKIIFQTLGLGIGVDIRDQVSISTGISGFYESHGKEISDANGSNGISDVGLSVSTSKKLGTFVAAEHSISASISSDFPLSERSRYEGYIALPGGQAGIESSLFSGAYSVSNSIGGSYVFNRYSYSPTDHSPTPLYSFNYRLGNSIRIYEALSIGVGFGVKYHRDTDGFSNGGFSFNNSESLSYTLGKLSASLNYSNGGFYDGEHKTDLWFIDRYRVLVSLGLSYGF